MNACEFESLLKFKKVSVQKLMCHGFEKKDGFFELRKNIFENQFSLEIKIDFSGNVFTKVFDIESGEEYSLYKVKSAQGKFVGEMRSAIESEIKAVVENCYETEVFKNAVTKKIIKYVSEKYGDELEFLWEKFSDNAVYRRKDNQKWYCLICVVKKEKLGIKESGKAEVIGLRIDPEDLDSVFDGKSIFPAYHMNKKHWFTILLDGSVPFEKIKSFLDESYELAFGKKRRYEKSL